MTEIPEEEIFEVIDAQGRVTGLAPRSQCHGDPSLRHRVVHVLVCDPDGRIYLQKRAWHKDVQPGKWDTSVGGHVHPGESLMAAVARELEEELGIGGVTPRPAYAYEMRSPIETEWVETFTLSWNGEIRPNAGEISEGRWWTLDEINAQLGTDRFTPNFEEEFRRWCAYTGRTAIEPGGN